MKKRIPIGLFSLLFVLLIFGYIAKTNSVTTINYFPIDKNINFNYAKTTISLTSFTDDNTYRINWTSESQTNKIIYLRQDISLLYDRGKLKGIRSKWLENTDLITFQEEIYGQENSLFQTISFHHGEIHYDDDDIKSVQIMSDDHLYVVKNSKSHTSNFKSPKLKWEVAEKEQLDLMIKKQLLSHWDMLIRHFNVNTDHYRIVPLNELVKYSDEQIPSLTKEQTEKIIGQLWEGLYKNYIIPITSTKLDNFNNYMPLVLFAKDNTHLIVLFEINGLKEKLIQQYS